MTLTNANGTASLAGFSYVAPAHSALAPMNGPPAGNAGTLTGSGFAAADAAAPS